MNSILFEEVEEGLCVQCLHVGSYDKEPETFSLIEAFCKENNIRRTDKRHREIYLNDARRTLPEKLKTVLRINVSR